MKNKVIVHSEIDTDLLYEYLHDQLTQGYELGDGEVKLSEEDARKVAKKLVRKASKPHEKYEGYTDMGGWLAESDMACKMHDFWSIVIDAYVERNIDEFIEKE